MKVTERIERFFTLDEEEKEILRKASDILGEIGEAVESFGKIFLIYTKFTEPSKKTHRYDEGNLYDFADLLAALSEETQVNIE